MNEKESMQLIRVGFDRINQLLEQDQLDLDELSVLISGVVHLNDPDTLALSFVDHTALQKISMSIEDISAQGFDFLKKVIEPGNLPSLLQVLDTYQQQPEPNVPVVFFQNYRYNEELEYNWTVTTMTYNQRLNKLFCIDFDLKQLGNYSNKIRRIAEEDVFKSKHFSQYHSLTRREKEVLQQIALGSSNQQISDQLFLSKDTVRTHRNRIWQKLEISNLKDAITYAQAFDLI